MSLTCKDLNEVLSWLSRTKPGIYPLKEKYTALREISSAGKIYKRGDKIYLDSETAKKLIFGSVQKDKDQSELQQSIRKIKFYIDFRGTLDIPEVEFSKDYTKIKIYGRRIQNPG